MVAPPRSPHLPRHTWLSASLAALPTPGLAGQVQWHLLSPGPLPVLMSMSVRRARGGNTAQGSWSAQNPACIPGRPLIQPLSALDGSQDPSPQSHTVRPTQCLHGAAQCPHLQPATVPSLALQDPGSQGLP